MALQSDRLLYRLYSIKNGKINSFIGCAFPIAPDGCMLTCAHVIEGGLKEGEAIAIFDNELGAHVIVNSIVYSKDKNLDIAYLPNALKRKKLEYLPIIRPDILQLGEDVYTYGHHRSSEPLKPQNAYLKGHIVNFTNFPEDSQHLCIRVSYPFIQGISGSPILTYHNGVKVVGLAHNNSISRVVAREVLEYKGEKEHFKETINKIIEYGIAYHPLTIASFCSDIGIANVTCTDQRVEIPGLS